MQKHPPHDTPALAAESVSKIYHQWQRDGNVKNILKNLLHPAKRSITALDNLTLNVQRGEFVAYAGANGAGKSTTIKLLSGLLQPTSGSVRVLGVDPAKNRVELMRRVGVLFGQRSDLWWDFPVIASYEWKRSVWNIEHETYNCMLEIVTEMLDLSSILNTFARELSLGQRMRADLGMLLLHNPEVIFLDEPTLGLDVLAKQHLIQFLRHLNAENRTTILVTSHDIDDLQQMADRIVLLSNGKLAFDGSFAQLRESRSDSARVRIVARCENPPTLPGLQLQKHEGDELFFTFNDREQDITEMLGSLSALGPIQDIEIQKAPIEDVIANLYRSWQKPAT